MPLYFDDTEEIIAPFQHDPDMACIYLEPGSLPYVFVKEKLAKRAPGVLCALDERSCLTLFDVDTAACKMLIYFLIQDCPPTVSSHMKADDDEYHKLLVTAWGLGHRMKLVIFQNELMCALMSSLLDMPVSFQDHNKELDLIVFGFENSPARSPIWKFMADRLVLNTCGQWSAGCDTLGRLVSIPGAWEEVGRAFEEHHTCVDDEFWDRTEDEDRYMLNTDKES